MRKSVFGFVLPDEEKDFSTDCSKSLVPEYGLELDKETGSTKIVKKGDIDYGELINSYKDQCGMTMAMKMIQSGQVSDDAFADDGKHSVDASFPTDIGTAAAFAAMSDEEAQALADRLGINDYKASDIDALVDARIKEIFAKAETAGKAAE